MFGRLFNIHKKQTPPTSAISVGRYSDNNKTVQQLASWTHSENLFKEKKFLESIEHFFKYLADEAENNVLYQKTPTGFTFEIYQGSKIIRGVGENLHMYARTSLAKMAAPSVPVMRRLLEQNYLLYYSRFSLNDTKLIMQFDSEIATASANKLYYALRELCITADKQDDLLIDDFDLLQISDTEHIQEIPVEIKKIKFSFLHLWLDEVLKKSEDLDKEKFSGAISFLILSLIFRIDYLITPEGALMNQLEKIQAIYFKKDNVSAFEKNRLMLEELKKLKLISEEDFNKSLFKSKSTFSIRPPKPQHLIREAIEGANKNISWYRDNKHPDIGKIVAEYGIAFCNYSFSLPKPLTDLCKIFMEINYADYFLQLGSSTLYYNIHTQRFKSEKIEEDIQQIIKVWSVKYPKLNFASNKLNYENLMEFNVSFTNIFANMDLEN